MPQCPNWAKPIVENGIAHYTHCCCWETFVQESQTYPLFPKFSSLYSFMGSKANPTFNTHVHLLYLTTLFFLPHEHISMSACYKCSLFVFLLHLLLPLGNKFLMGSDGCWHSCCCWCHFDSSFPTIAW